MSTAARPTFPYSVSGSLILKSKLSDPILVIPPTDIDRAHDDALVQTMLRLVALQLAAAWAAPAYHAEGEYSGGWSRAAEPLLEGRVSFSLVLVHDAREVERIAAAVSNPASPSYGSYLSRDAADRLSAPSGGAVEAVRGWLDGSGAALELRGARATICADVASASRLLRTSFHEVRHASRAPTTLVRAAAFRLPPTVARVTTAVFGLHGLPAPPRRAATAAGATAVEVTPAVLSATYGIGGVNVSRAAGSKNARAVAEFQGEYMSSRDLATFFKEYVPAAVAGDEKVSKWVGKHVENTRGVRSGRTTRSRAWPSSARPSSGHEAHPV